MINPIGGRNYQGYIRADAPLDEEDEEDQGQHKRGESTNEDDDIESRGARKAAPSAKSQGKRRAGMSGSSAWHGDASEMNVLRPNIHRKEEQDESEDDEVPQDFMIEARSPPKHSPAAGRLKSKRTSSGSGGTEGKVPAPPTTRSTSGGRTQPLYSIAGAKSSPKAPQPLLPTHNPVPQPPKPSDLGSRSTTPLSVPRAPSSLGGTSNDGTRHQGKTMRGLDEYEKALWNWVNVYNLDAYLQEVYAYYEGNGIYSIALSRGLNLL